MSSNKQYKEPGPKTRFFFGRIFPLIFVAVGFGLFWKGSAAMNKKPDAQKITPNEL